MEHNGSANTSSIQAHEAGIDPLQQFAAYPFTTDDTFQQGLASIIAGDVLDGKSDAEKLEIIRRSQVFYFNRVTGHSITVEDTLRYDALPHGASPADSGAYSAPSSSTANDEEQRTLTFAELKEMIEMGKTDQIPNNKLVPDVLNDAPPSESKAALKKKPWEVSA